VDLPRTAQILSSSIKTAFNLKPFVSSILKTVLKSSPTYCTDIFPLDCLTSEIYYSIYPIFMVLILNLLPYGIVKGWKKKIRA